MLTNRDSGNARSCRLASCDRLAPRECENPFDDVRRFKQRKETVIVKVARCRVLLDTVPPGTIGTDCSEHVGRTGDATHARRFSYADASATDYRLGAAARRDATRRGQR
ncbi:LysR family transcriptional regulator [Burkholderia multivorans]|nr:LysR family transcriptional regulator [Burkholderia multivorans]PRF10448.1 LysR family transcriptional regulator [Burkholderia multivorans]